MKKIKEETKLKLSKNQLQSIVNSHIQETDGVHELFNMMVNGLNIAPMCSLWVV
ncbi:MAG: hypothetical protein AB8B61_08315 [Cyclobacteriaceae bacterium]